MLVAMFGAPLVDRLSRKRIMVVTDIARGLAVATLLLVGTPSLSHLYGGSFGYGQRLLLTSRAALALEVQDRVVDVSWPASAG